MEREGIIFFRLLHKETPPSPLQTLHSTVSPPHRIPPPHQPTFFFVQFFFFFFYILCVCVCFFYHSFPFLLHEQKKGGERGEVFRWSGAGDGRGVRGRGRHCWLEGGMKGGCEGGGGCEGCRGSCLDPCSTRAMQKRDVARGRVCLCERDEEGKKKNKGFSDSRGDGGGGFPLPSSQLNSSPRSDLPETSSALPCTACSVRGE